MKTDREFLDGIYQKAKNMTQEKPKKKKVHFFSCQAFSAAAAAALIGYIFYFSAVPQSQTGTAPAPAPFPPGGRLRSWFHKPQSVPSSESGQPRAATDSRDLEGQLYRRTGGGCFQRNKNFSFLPIRIR